MDYSSEDVMVTKIVKSLLDIRYTLRLVYQHAVDSVNPYNLIQKEIKYNNNILCVRNRSYKLNKNVFLVGFGKAILGMAYQTELKLGDHLKKGILSIPVGQKKMFKQFNFRKDSVIDIFEGANNNIPDEDSENAAKQIAEMVEKLAENDILIVLVSGGGSALLPFPVSPVTLHEKAEVIKLLSKAGADITELNSTRKRISVLKGGGLLNLAYPAKVITFILSDIVGDPLDFIASGPTVYNTDSPDKPKLIFEKYSLLDKIPLSVKQIVLQPVPESVNKANVQNLLIGSNKIALEAALYELKNHNYAAFILSDVLEGLVSDICIYYIDLILSICKSLCNIITKNEFVTQTVALKQNLKIRDDVFIKLIDCIFNSETSKICLLVGGEPTVKVTGNGKGGRSQQLALEFSDALNKCYLDSSFMRDFNIGLLCGGTDGIDGPTDAAGAVAYSGQMRIAIEQNLYPNSFIQNCDAYTFFSKLNKGEDLLKIGHTGTNVMDIHIILIDNIKNI